MPIRFHPALGDTLWCEYTGLVPEMVKRRLVVVVSPKACERQGLVTVVPLSATSPTNGKAWHVRLDRDPLPGSVAAGVWAKCDMIGVVSFARLHGYYTRWNGKRQYRRLAVSASELRRIREGIVAALGLQHWMRHPPLDTRAPTA